MRNLKKFLALVLAMLMVVSAAATVSAFEDVAEDNLFADAIADLSVLDIVNGYDGETFGPEDAVTRQQFALMMARAITGITDDAEWAQGGLVAFDDVTEYQYAIATVVKAGIVDGFLDNTFRPEEGVTFIQALKMAVCALGYDDGTLDWWQGYYNVALDLGLTANLNQIPTADYALNRGEVAQLIYNMLYATAANGSSLAYDIFGIGVEEPVEEPAELTTFVLTATDEQTAYEGMDVAEGGYVGLQLLVNGIAEGDMLYLPVEMFGFEDGEDEAAFLSAFALANYDAENGTFDEIIPVGTSWKIYNTEVSDIKNGKFKYDGKNYYPVEEITGTEIKNEVVLYNATNYGYNDGNKQLFLNAKGEVLGKDGKVVLEAVYSVAGNIVSYLEVSTGKYLSVSNATATYGEVIDEIAQSYTIVDTAALTGAYELTVYDDDMDGKMDRAYWTPVYVAVQGGYNDGDDYEVAGPFWDEDESDKGKITGMEDLAKGDIFVYTYNKQLREVTVLEVLEQQEATVKKINTTKQSASDGYSTITLTDGTALTLYNKSTKAGTAEAKLGAKIGTHGKGAVDYTKDAWVSQITGSYKFELVDDVKLLSKLEAGSLIRYYARNNVVLFAETYNIEDVFTRVILKEVVDADTDAIYADAYINGKVEEIKITKINDKDLADVSWIKMSNIIAELAAEAEKGQVYRIAELEDGYQISEALDDAKGANAKAFKLVKLNATADITFEDGIADAYAGAYDKTNRIRTNENTIWYFINRDAKGTTVKVVDEAIDEATIDVVTGKTTIFADKLGYSGDNKGTASVVYVFNAGEDTTGFGWNELKDISIVYVSAAINSDSTVDYYEAGDAEDLGLDAKEYTRSNYYMYASKYVMDMYSGKATTVFSAKPLLAGNFYYVNEDGYIDNTEDTAANKPLGVEIASKSIVWSNITLDDQYVAVKGILNADWEVSTLCVYKAAGDSIKTASGDIDDIITSTSIKVYYVKGYENASSTLVDADGRFALVAGDVSSYDENYEAPSVADTAPTAFWNAAGNYYMGTLSDMTIDSAKLAGTFKFISTSAKTVNFEDDLDMTKLMTIGDDEITKVVSIRYRAAGSTGAYTTISGDGISIDFDVDDNAVSFEVNYGRKTSIAGSAKLVLAKGDYEIVVCVELDNGAWRDMTGYFNNPTALS